MRCLYLVLAVCFINSQMVKSQEKNISADLILLYDYVLDSHPNIKSGELQLKCAVADRQSALGRFDLNVISSLDYSFDQNGLFSEDPTTNLIGSNLNAHNLLVSSGIAKRFRSGIDMTASISYGRIANNLPLNAFNENIGPFVADNTTSVDISLVYPLLRNRGRDIVIAGESLADLSIAAETSNLKTTISQSVFSMTMAYWEYLFASQSYSVYRSNEERVEKVLINTKELVSAERRPESDLLQIEADLLDKSRQSFIAEQQKIAAKLNLGRAVGLGSDESELISIPLSQFPDVLKANEVPAVQGFLAFARKYRPDLQVLREILEQFRINKRLAENNTKPQLDLSAFSSYSGTQNGNNIANVLSALGQSQGRNYHTGIGLSYRFPIQNNAAKGAQLKASLQVEDQEVRLDNQIRNIELSISIAHSNLLNSITTVEKAEKALNYYREVYENEQIKFRSGLTTLLNVIIFQERLTFSELDFLRAQFQYASAITELRFRTGMNTISNDRSDSIHDLFYSLPRQN